MTAVDTLPVGLGLDPEEAQTRFDGLQAKLVPLWQSMEPMTQDEQTIVVVCSMTLEDPNMPAAVLQAYEERFLFLLLLLRQPRARLVYVTSQAVQPEHRRLLPRPAPGHHPLARAAATPPRVSARRLVAAAVREAPRAAAAARADPQPRARSRPRPPRPLQHDGARARPRARAGDPDVRRRSSLLPVRDEDRLPAPVRRAGRAASARPGGPVHDRGAWRRRSPSCARSVPECRR